MYFAREIDLDHPVMNLVPASPTTMYAVSVVLECEHRSADGVTDVHTYSVQVPTFYLMADVQGIIDDVHAASIAKEMFSRTENLVECHVSVVETGMAAHSHR